MHALAEFWPRGLFEVEHVEVQGGLIKPGRLPRSRFFVWNDPNGKHDILVFIGEAQPPTGKHAFCQKLIDFAKQAGVQRVFTFAAMATQMHPKDPSRVFAAATDAVGLAELKELDVHVVEDGQISGLNGVLLGVAAENGLRGYSLLGEMPHLFAQLPFPKASLAVLKSFTKFAGIEIDFGELEEQATAMEEQLGQIVTQIEKAIAEQASQDEEEDEGLEFPIEPEEDEQPKLSSEEEAKIERLFEQARANRAKAYELKGLLDRLNVFKDFEDRFLDLFKKKAG
jgi:proteasome assembly chaperone (PAC2) family protein